VTLAWLLLATGLCWPSLSHADECVPNLSLPASLCAFIDTRESTGALRVSLDDLGSKEPFFTCQMAAKAKEARQAVRRNDSSIWDAEAVTHLASLYRSTFSRSAQASIAVVGIEVTDDTCSPGEFTVLAIWTATRFELRERRNSCDATKIVAPLNLQDVCTGTVGALLIRGSQTLGDAVDRGFRDVLYASSPVPSSTRTRVEENLQWFRNRWIDIAK
jgi:hypothetical protein